LKEDFWMNSGANGKNHRRVFARGAVGLLALTALGLAAPACLDRPVAPQQPLTKRLSTQLYQNQKVDKIDILFMIDNSASMADKQKILADAVPDLVERLTNPVCVDRTTREYKGEAAPGASCADAFPGTEREFDPIVDIHIGVITSSLGGVGADSCSNVTTQNYNPRQEDMARLITRGKNDAGETVAVPTYENMGFLNWDPTGKKSSPPGENNVANLKKNFTEMVRGADQDGCGFEMSLEAWRRFLVDPAPYEKMIPIPCNDGDTRNSCRGPEGVDQVVLQQRKDFLRKDSLLAIVMLSDENDCSVIAGGQFYLALQALDGTGSFRLARGTDACLSDPWSENCKSCWEPDSAAFPECAAGWPNPDKDDTLNLRCFEQKRRFGIDFLHPIRRYIDALKEARFWDDTLNPVFCNEFTDDTRKECKDVLRDPSLIFLAGIVGVPWQDLANDHTDLKKGYRPVEQLRWTPSVFTSNNQTPPPGLPDGKTLWNMILGEVDENPGTDADGDGRIAEGEKNKRYGAIVPTVAPLDPLMIESVDPRSGEHPITGVALVQPGTNPVGHPVNSSERVISTRNDLQYACTFELPQPIDCSLPQNSFGCDCGSSSTDPLWQNPLCYNTSSSDFGTQQYRAKAYPGRRQLAVLKGMDTQAIVASVCPSNMSNTAAADFGYRPAIGAIVDRLKAALQGTCWNQELQIDSEGKVPCVVLEATKGDVDAAGNALCAPCVDGRTEASDQQKKALETDPVYKENQLNCVCQINQATPGPDLQACVSQEVVTGVKGWCYIDPSQEGSHNLDIVASCPPANKRLIRFVGDNVPVAGSLTFLQCVGATFGSSTEE
jgi:hypothetical protein